MLYLSQAARPANHPMKSLLRFFSFNSYVWLALALFVVLLALICAVCKEIAFRG